MFIKLYAINNKFTSELYTKEFITKYLIVIILLMNI